MLLPVCSAVPSCSPLYLATTSQVARRVDISTVLQSHADPLIAQVPDRPLLVESSIFSPYTAALGFGAVAELPGPNAGALTEAYDRLRCSTYNVLEA
jgi:hypothetical protein